MKIKNLKKEKFIIFLFVYFIFLTLSFTVFSLSKYVGVVKKSSTFEIARWDVDLDTTTGNESITNDTLSVTSGTTNQDYKLTVTNNSDVAVEYTIIVKNLPTGIKVSLDNGTAQNQDSNHQIRFSNVGTINANATNNSAIHKLTFSAPLGTAEVNNQNINIEVIFVQKEI